jgi:hypothetical protein
LSFVSQKSKPSKLPPAFLTALTNDTGRACGSGNNALVSHADEKTVVHNSHYVLEGLGGRRHILNWLLEGQVYDVVAVVCRKGMYTHASMKLVVRGI